MAQNITFTLPSGQGNTANPKVNTSHTELIRQAFGYNNVTVNNDEEDTKYKIDDAMDEGKAALFDYPLFMPLIFTETKYDILIDGSVKEDGAETPRIIFPVVLIEASRSKIIEVTTIEGKNGSIKEFSSLSDYDVSLKGIFVGNDGNYPSQQVQNLARLESCPVAINISNTFLGYMGVKKLIVKRINWRSMQGYENLQAFELECISDKDVELIINDKQ